MSFSVLGINHRCSSIDARERFVIHATDLHSALYSLRENCKISEAVILSTCNRTEIYVQAEENDVVLSWLSDYLKVPLSEIASALYVINGEKAVRHVFRVASGLDSMVLGETQILGQMKEAVRVARESGALGIYLDKLFQHSFVVAKKIRSTTRIGANIISLATAALRLASKHFKHISDCSVLFIGAGEMIELAVARFAPYHPKSIVIANRTQPRAESLSRRFNAKTALLTELDNLLVNANIVVTGTSAPDPMITEALLKQTMQKRGNFPLLMIDLAVPRDIEASVSKVEGVTLYSIDDLATIVESGKESRQGAVHEAEELVLEQVRLFMNWLHTRKTVPLIRSLRDSMERIRRHEMERSMKALQQGQDPQVVLNQFSNRLMNKFLHTPNTALAHAEHEQDELTMAVSRLFNLRH